MYLQTLGTHHLVTWILIGMVVGAIAGRVVYGSGFGCVANIAVGLGGAVIGGILLHQLGPATGFIDGGIVDDFVVSFLGAVLLLAVLRALSPSSWRSRGGRRWHW